MFIDKPGVTQFIEESELYSDISDEERECLSSIKQWLAKNPKINARQDDISLLYFIRGCNFNLEKIKEKIQRFYKMRTERVEWFANRDPFLKEIQELLEIGVFLPLAEKDVHNRKVFVIRTAAHNPKIHTQNNVFKVGKMILDLALEMDPEISRHGLAAIFDMKGVTLGHALQLTPTIIKRSVESWQIYPCKPKVLEFINVPAHVNITLNVFRMFMSPKMKSRIIVRKGTSEIKTKLPVELGGQGESYITLTKYWKDNVERHAQFFIKDDMFKTIL